MLEIGAGSGYQAAVLSRLATRVISIERIAPLAEQARQTLQHLNITNVEIIVADGGYGWAKHAPYDGILVTAAAPHIPPPLLTQLENGANLIAPVGPKGHQDLLCFQRQGERIVKQHLVPVAFVPLRGEHGWQPNDYL